MPTTMQEGLHYRQRLDDVTWQRLTGRIVKDHEEIELAEAEQIMDATIGFLLLCGQYPEHGFSPSERVDIGWHTFLLYTKEYVQFCEGQVGFFVHHAPSDIPGVDYTFDGGVDAVEFMRQHGIAFNEGMWPESHSTRRCTCAGINADPEPRPQPDCRCCGGC